MPRPTKTVEIQEWIPGDDFDGLDGQWETVAEVPAYIKPMGGKEVVIAGVQVAALHDVEISIRRISWLTTKHRLIGQRNQIWNIASKSSDRQRARWLTLRCVQEGTLDRERAYSISKADDFAAVGVITYDVVLSEDGLSVVLDEDGSSLVLAEA
jgi:head-tail adaptor